MSNSDNKFSWVQTHKEIVEYISGKKDSQKELIDLLKNAGATIFNDRDEEGSTIELEEIDPFTFFCYINKYGPAKRLKILQNVAKETGVEVPNDEKGLPSANAQKVWLFPYKKDRTNNEIHRLWSFFKSTLDEGITNDKFQDILNIQNVAETKLTEALFYVKPEQYLPINGPTIPYLSEVLSINPSFATWEEYLDILKQLRAKTDKAFYEISYEAWLWNEERKKEDVLRINMRGKASSNYWLFQGNPSIFDIEQSLKDETLTTWRVNAHKDRIKPGDKVILWASGNKRGVYALAEIESDVYEDEVNEVEAPYYFDKPDDDAFDQVRIRITHNLANDPISYDQIKNVEELKDLNIGNQGTNFSATKEEYEALARTAEIKMNSKRYWLYSPGPSAKHWEEFYQDGVMRLGWESLGDLTQYSTKDEIVKRLQDIFDTDSSKKNDATANWDFCNEIRKGDVIIAKKGRSKYIGYGIVTSDYYFDDTRNDFNSTREVNWTAKGVWEEPKGDNIVKTLTDITPYPDYVARILKLMGIEKIKMTDNTLNHPLNTIFYGPPGTGKTYSTIKRAAEIVTGREIEDYDEAKRIFNDGLGETIEFITFHQNYSYEDFIQGLRPDLQGGDQLSFKRVDGVFKRIADKALINYKESKKAPVELNKKKAFEEALDTLKEKVIESTDQVRINETAYFIGVEEDAFRYSADNWTLDGKGFNGFRMKFTDLIDFFENNITERREIRDLKNVSGLAKQHATYFFNTYRLIKDLVEENNTQEASTEKKNYVIIIDEINRANISRVFGELITLIEPDKRYGRELHIPAKLPSGESFSVPENLYIIGTMNTADKSIALLDIALRRRFEFEAMYPKYQIDGEVIHDKDVLKKINERIVELKGHDFQIGHSYFMENDTTLKQRMNRKIIPLLLEYFMNDEKEVKSILEYADLQIEENSWPLRITGKK